ncbi:MspA family porin [Gordonia sp. NPDC003376]
MSKFSKLGLRRAAGACAVVAAAAVGVAGMGAGHAEAAPLQSGYKSASGIDGEKVQTWRKNESQYSVARVAANGLGRTALVSGTYTTQASEGVGGKLYVGFLVGCQVDVSGIKVGGNSGISATLGASPSISASGSLSIPLAPGEASLYSVTSKSLKDGSATIQLSDFELEFPNCGGYASARSVVLTRAVAGYEVNDDDDTIDGSGTLIQSTLYGQPFFVS